MRWIACFALAVGILALSVVLPGGATPPPRLVQPPAGLSHLTRAQAVASARGTGAAPADARLMDYRKAAALLGGGPDPSVDPGAEVWVVTVLQPTPFTVILDGVDGAVIDACIGCRVL